MTSKKNSEIIEVATDELDLVSGGRKARTELFTHTREIMYFQLWSAVQQFAPPTLRPHQDLTRYAPRQNYDSEGTARTNP